MKHIKGIIATVIFVSAFLRCTTMVAGGAGGETTNGIVASVYNQQGVPASGAEVRLRRADYYTAIPAGAAKAAVDSNVIYTFNGVLGPDGKLAIASVETGSYIIEVNDGNGYACALRCSVTSPDSQIDLGADTLKKTCSISGAIPPDMSARYVQIGGLERLAALDPKSGEFHISNLPAGTFVFHFVSDNPARPPLLVDTLTLRSGDSLALPRYFAWRHSQYVQFNTTPAGANVGSDVARFPVLVRLTAQNFTFSQARSDGSDIRFAKSDSTPLAYEIERWDANAGRAEIWVRVDTVFGNNATQSIIMFWGASAGSDSLRSGSAAVFDTANGFLGVWHLGQAGGTTAFDATADHYDGTPFNMTAASAVSGAIGIAQKFDGRAGYFQMAGTAAGKLNFPRNGTYSVSAWVNADTLDQYWHTIASKGDYQYNLEIVPSDEWQFAEYNDGKGWDMTTSPGQAKTWTYLTGVRSGSKEYLYVNGALVDSIIFLNTSTLPRYTGFDFLIGRNRNPASDTTGFFFKGMIDEVRVSNVAPSADWIKLCYMNQKAIDALVVLRP
jgi:hypothetical protein